MRLKIGAIALALVVGGAAPIVAQETPAWVQEMTAEWYTALEAGQVSAMKRLLAPDAAIMFPTKTVRGRDQLDGFLDALFKTKRYESCEWQIESVATVDRMVAVVTQSLCHVDSQQGNRGKQDVGYRVMKVYEQQADESWLIVRIDAQATE